jgi:hypothetical protein
MVVLPNLFRRWATLPRTACVIARGHSQSFEMARDHDDAAPLPPLPPSLDVLGASTFGPHFRAPVKRPRTPQEGRGIQAGEALDWPEIGPPGRAWGDAERLVATLEVLLERRRRAVRSLWIESKSEDPKELALNALARQIDLSGTAAERGAADTAEIAAIDAALAGLAPRLATVEALAEGNADAREHVNRLGAAALAELGAALAELRAMVRGEDVPEVRDRASAALRRAIGVHPAPLTASELSEARGPETPEDRATVWVLGSQHARCALGLLSRALPEVPMARIVREFVAAAGSPALTKKLKASRGRRFNGIAMDLIAMCRFAPSRRTLRRWRVRTAARGSRVQ